MNISKSNSRIVLDSLVWLIEEAFRGDPSHSLLVNLKDLQDEDWTATPPGSQRWLASVRALPNDAELDRDRLTYWGERLPTRHIIRMMIAHDFYHAREINHIRALLQGTDRWPYE